jgi:hypothetical protein
MFGENDLIENHSTIAHASESQNVTLIAAIVTEKEKFTQK